MIVNGCCSPNDFDAGLKELRIALIELQRDHPDCNIIVLLNPGGYDPVYLVTNVFGIDVALRVSATPGPAKSSGFPFIEVRPRVMRYARESQNAPLTAAGRELARRDCADRHVGLVWPGPR